MKNWIKTQHSKNENHGIWSHHFMANKWRNNAVRDFIFLGSKIIAGGDCNHGLKMLIPWKKSCDKPRQSIKKQRHYLPTKVHLVIAFPVVMYGCESWTIMKGECQRIDAFELWCWRRPLEIPLDCKDITPVNPKANQA